MTVFNPKNKKELTYGEALGPAMEITEADDAKQYMEAYTKWIQGQIDSAELSGKMPASEMASHNIGYYAGYYSTEVQNRVKQLFGATHPILS